MMKRKPYTAILFILALPHFSANANAMATDRGSVIGVEALGTKNQSELQAIAADFPGNIKVNSGADMYRISYWTVLKRKPVRASGLFSVPHDDLKPKGVVMYLHGTNMTRSLSPSQPDRVDGNEETAIFAGNGYYVVLPDYVGLGISTEPQAYIVTKPQVDASLDMLRAVRKVAAQMKLNWSPSLYMMGFSQGGQSVAGVHRELEKRPLPGYSLKGSIGVAGPYALRQISLPKLACPASLENYNIGYLAFAAYAYATYYDRPLDDVFAPQLVVLIPPLFDGSKSPAEIISALPDDARKLFQPQFLRDLESQKGNWFRAAIDANETFKWVPKAPFRAYFGESDANVAAEASNVFFNYARSRGGNISVHSLGRVDHQTSASLTYAPALAWFDEFSSAH